MKSPRRILFIGAALGLLAAFACFFIAGSLWFFLALFPDASGQVRRIGYDEDLFISAPPQVRDGVYKSIDLPEHVVQGFHKIAYQHDERGKALVGIPKLGRQATMRSQLEQESWAVKRLGLLLIAYRQHEGRMQEVPGKGVLFALRETLGNSMIRRLPLRPGMVFQETGKSEDEQPLSLYIERQSGSLHAAISLHEEGFLAGKNKRMNHIGGDNVSFVSLQTDVLSRLSNRFNAIIQSEVAKSLGFKKTNPNIIGDLLAIGPLTIAKKDGSLAIGTFSTENMSASIMKEWISAEQAVRHPQRRAFALPDKTIGYEYIPGKTNARFELNKGKNNCLPSEGYDEKVFLCGQDRAVVFTNEESLGGELLAYLQTERTAWSGIIQGELLMALGFEGAFSSLEYSGDDTLVEVWLDARDPTFQSDPK